MPGETVVRPGPPRAIRATERPGALSTPVRPPSATSPSTPPSEPPSPAAPDELRWAAASPPSPPSPPRGAEAPPPDQPPGAGRRPPVDGGAPGPAAPPCRRRSDAADEASPTATRVAPARRSVAGAPRAGRDGRPHGRGRGARGRWAVRRCATAPSAATSRRSARPSPATRRAWCPPRRWACSSAVGRRPPRRRGGAGARARGRRRHVVALVPAADRSSPGADRGRAHPRRRLRGRAGPRPPPQALAAGATVADRRDRRTRSTRPWAQLVEPVGPVDGARSTTPVGEWPAGEVELQPDRRRPLPAAPGRRRGRAGPVERQQAFWDAWLPLVRDAGDGRAARRGRDRVRPVRPGDRRGGRRRRRPPGRRARTAADGVALPGRRPCGSASLVSATIPFPTSPAPGVRVRVRLLNGTDEPDAHRARGPCAGRRAAPRSPSSATPPRSPSPRPASCTRDPAVEDQAALDGGRRSASGASSRSAPGRMASASTDDDIDVTVILGQDAEDLSGRSRPLTDRNDRASARDLAIAAARAADARERRDIVMLEVGDVLVVADEFVIVSASNDRQVKAIVDDIERAVGDGGLRQAAPGRGPRRPALGAHRLRRRRRARLPRGDPRLLRARAPLERRAPARVGRGGRRRAPRAPDRPRSTGS